MRALRLLVILMAIIGAPVLRAEVKTTGHVAHGSAQGVGHQTEEHGEGEDAPKTYFGIPGWILKLANLLFFIGVLVYLLKGPIGAGFRARGEEIRAQLEEARTRRAKSDQLASDIQRKLSEIEREVQSVLTRAQEEGERQKREIIEGARLEAEKILNAARNEVDSRIKQARKELTEYAGTLAADRARQILESSLTDQDRKRLFDDSVRNVAGKQS